MIDDNTMTCSSLSDDTKNMINILSNLSYADVNDGIYNDLWNISNCNDVCKWNPLYFEWDATDTILETITLSIDDGFYFSSKPIIPTQYNWPANVTSSSRSGMMMRKID